MPELAEVENFKLYLDKTSLNKVIEDIHTRDETFPNISNLKLKSSLKGKKIESTKRHGKYIFLKIGSKFLVLHFGMTGNLKFFKNIEEEPKFSKIMFKFKNGSYLSYISIRKFGKIDIINSIKNYIKQIHLGPDALEISFEQFKEVIKRRSAHVKSVLMNQEIVAGIGNIYSDEILFQSKLHPKTKINNINEDKMLILFNNIKKVLYTAIEKEGNLQKMPKSFIIPHRNEKGFCPICTSKIERIALSGRHGYFCPSCQIY